MGRTTSFILLLCAVAAISTACKSPEQIQSEGNQDATTIIVKQEPQDSLDRITTTGTATFLAYPDTATLVFSVQTAEKQEGDGVAVNNGIVNELIDALSARGVLKEDITRSACVAYGKNAPNEEHQRLSFTHQTVVTVVVRDTAKVELLLSEVLSDNVILAGETYECSTFEEQYQKALSLAVEDAQKKAEAISLAMNRSLTERRSFKEQTYDMQPFDRGSILFGKEVRVTVDMMFEVK